MADTTQQDWKDLYNASADEIMQKSYDVWQQMSNAISTYNEWDIADRLRLKTGWVADLDSQINQLHTQLNLSRPQLMDKYSSIINPTQREALISAEQQSISKNISELQAIRQYRLGTIQDMINADISDSQNKIKWLEAQYNLYRDVMWDKVSAQKAKADMEKEALNMREQELKLKAMEQEYGMSYVPWKTTYWSTDITDLQSQYPNNASFKNNNPGNIKYNENWANTLKQYGIEIQKWTPATDWGNFARYNSVEDALMARNILLFKTSVYPTLTVEQAMRRYSNGGYWAEVTGIDWNKKMSDLTSQERAKLVSGQLKAEDWQMYQELIKRGIDPQKITTEWGYQKTGKSESEIKAEEEAKLEWPLDIKTVEEYNNNRTQLTTPQKIKEKLSIESINSILMDDAEKWLLSETDRKQLLESASPEVVQKYYQWSDVSYIKSLLEEWDTQWIIDEVRGLIEEDWVTKEYAKDILIKAGILDKDWKGIAKWFKENSFLMFDDDALDELQWILDL